MTLRAATNVLVVETNRPEAHLLRVDLERRGARVRMVETVPHALAYVEEDPGDAVVIGVVEPGRAAVELVRRLRETDRSLCVLALVDESTRDQAVPLFREGATDVLDRPVSADAILARIARAFVGDGRTGDRAVHRSARRRGDGLVVGDHPRLEQVRRFAARVATVPNARVLITGESGTGKSLLARAIHELSNATGEFVEVNCAALPAHLLESELFGHEKGAFTDARQTKRGLLETAHRGTLLLDEIGALPLELQAKLLLFIERQTFRRVGGTAPIRAEARVIAATNDDLKARIRAREFRMDLLYRLDVTSVEMPALRAMPSIIPELARHFTAELCASMRRDPPPIGDETLARLGMHPWPGNGRELRNTIERALIFHDDGALEFNAPPVDLAPGSPGTAVPLDLTLDEVERRYIALMIETNPGVELNEIARRLGISRKTLWKKRRRHGL
ncbi:MAG: sigma-54-dependent transcriptional regulator [Longimicrobiales bacterium]